MEKKKKSKKYIIPATFFQALTIPQKKENISIKKEILSLQKDKQNLEKPKLDNLILKSIKRKSSSLSLKSVHNKKEDKKLAEEENFDNYPKDSFTEKKLNLYWKEYISVLQKKGENSMASIIASEKPKLEANFKIIFSVPNKLMKDQFLRNQPKLLKYLRDKLNNYGISIDLVLNEQKEKQFAYTPLEKFNKLKEKNPLLEKLRQTFELDL